MNVLTYTSAQLQHLQQFRQQRQPSACNSLQYCAQQLAAQAAALLQNSLPQHGSAPISSNKTGFRGVRQRAWGMFAAEIRDGAAGKRRWVGTYPSSEIAAQAYDGAAMVLHGAKAKTNFIYQPTTVKMYTIPKDNATAAEVLLADIAAGRNLPVPQGLEKEPSSTGEANAGATTQQEPAAAAAADQGCFNSASWNSSPMSSSHELHLPASSAGTPSSAQQRTVFDAAAEMHVPAPGFAQLLLQNDLSWMLQGQAAASAAAAASHSYLSYATSMCQAYYDAGDASPKGGKKAANMNDCAPAATVGPGLQSCGGTVAPAAERGGSSKLAVTCSTDSHIATEALQDERCFSVDTGSPMLCCSSTSVAARGDAAYQARGTTVQPAGMSAAGARDATISKEHSMHSSSAKCSMDDEHCDAAEAAAFPRPVVGTGLFMQQAALSARLRVSGSDDLLASGMSKLPSLALRAAAAPCNGQECNSTTGTMLPQPQLLQQTQQQTGSFGGRDQEQQDAAPLTADQAVAATAILSSLLKLDFAQQQRMFQGLMGTGLFAAKQEGSIGLLTPDHQGGSAARLIPNEFIVQQQAGAGQAAVVSNEYLMQAIPASGTGAYGAVCPGLVAVDRAVLQHNGAAQQKPKKRGRACKGTYSNENSSGSLEEACLPATKRAKMRAGMNANKAAAAAVGKAGVEGAAEDAGSDQMALETLADVAVFLGIADEEMASL